MSVSENIKRLCKERGTSMYKVEQALGLGNGTIGKWGKNGRVPHYDTLLSVASYLGVTISELMGDTTTLSTIGGNIVLAAGNLYAAKRALRSLGIGEDDINYMLYGGYAWTDGALAQIADALHCDVDSLKKEDTPTGIASERVLKISDLSAKLTEAEQDILIAQIEGILRSR